MKYLFLILSIVITISVNSQTQNYCKQKKTCNPTVFLTEVRELRNAEMYDSVITLINRKYLTDTNEMWPYFQLACFYSLKGDTLQPFLYLYKSINLGVDIEDILSDTDFDTIKHSTAWALLEDSINKIYLSNFPSITNKELSLRLWRLGIEDQKTRTLSSNIKNIKLQVNRRKLNNQFRKETKQRTQVIAELLKKEKRWPTHSEIGSKASFYAQMIIQHGGNKKLTKRALPLIKVAVDSNQANAEYYAMLLDRYLVQKNKKQIYGTQIYRTCDRKGNCSDLHFRPIEDEKNVNQRRAAIGLQSIEDLADKFGFKYVYHPEYEKLSCRKIRVLQTNQK